MAKPQKSTAQSEVPGLVKKGPLYYLKRDWQLYALMLLPMVFIIVFKYFAYTGLSVAFLDYKIGKGYAGSKFVGYRYRGTGTWCRRAGGSGQYRQYQCLPVSAAGWACNRCQRYCVTILGC